MFLLTAILSLICSLILLALSSYWLADAIVRMFRERRFWK